MLSDFEDFTVEQDVETVTGVSATAYQPTVESSGWFLSATCESRDVLRMRAMYFYRRKEFDKAFELYLRVLEDDHKPSFKFELLETAIRCGLRCSRIDRCAEMLRELTTLVKTPDQQFQFWHVAREVHRHTHNTVDWQRTLMLLLSDNDHNPHYWLELGETSPHLHSNLRLGCTVRALELLKRTASTDSGFAKDRNERLIDSLNQTVLSFPPEQVMASLVGVCSDIVDREQLPLEADATAFSYRDESESKVDSGRLLTSAEQQVVIENFQQRFSWLFAST